MPGSPSPSTAAARPGPAGVVALVGLSPVYAYGLRLGLVEAGVRCSDVPGFAELPALSEEDRVVVVLRTADAAALAAVDQPAQERLAPVHVLEDGTVQAYADALRAGATGAFPADADLDHVVRVVRCAAAGRTLLPLLVARAMGRRRAGAAPRLEAHERQYLRRLADGGTITALARHAGWSEREMYRLLSGVYARLGAANRTEALLLAERWGLLDEESR